MWRRQAEQLNSAGMAVFLSLMVSACSFGFGDSGNEISDEEKAKTNLDLGVRYMELGQYETALEKLDYALDLDSDNNRIYDAFGVLYERLGKDAEAEEYFEKAVRMKPDDAGVVSNYGRFLCNKGKYDQGMVHLKQAIASPLNTRRWFALTNAGYCEMKQGNYVQAEEYLRTALQQQQAYAPALLGMVNISYKKAEYFKARAFLERYTGIAPHSAETLWYAVQTERQLGNAQQAEDYRQLLLQKFPLSEHAKSVKNIYIKQ